VPAMHPISYTMPLEFARCLEQVFATIYFVGVLLVVFHD
jgi:hypothetical protein